MNVIIKINGADIVTGVHRNIDDFHLLLFAFFIGKCWSVIYIFRWNHPIIMNTFE